MPFRKEADWTQLGWKVWYSDGNTIDVYSSKSSDWDSLPAVGVQGMYRYYQKGEQKWKEWISGKDLYVEDSWDLDSLKALAVNFKLGEDTRFDLIRQAEALRATDTEWAGEFDDTMSRYTSTRKAFLGWKVWVNNNGVIQEHSSNTTSWGLLPNLQNILTMYRVYREKGTTWKERVNRENIYTEDKSQESTVTTLSTKVKTGSVISDALMSQVITQMQNDTEEF